MLMWELFEVEYEKQKIRKEIYKIWYMNVWKMPQILLEISMKSIDNIFYFHEQKLMLDSFDVEIDNVWIKSPTCHVESIDLVTRWLVDFVDCLFLSVSVWQ